MPRIARNRSVQIGHDLASFSAALGSSSNSIRAITPRQSPSRWVSEKKKTKEMYPVGACGADFAAHLRDQFDAYARVIREADIKAE